jgi:ATP-binding cassette subfamily B protein
MHAYGQEDWHRARFAELNELERQALRRAAYVFGGFLVAAELVVGLVIALLVSVGGHQVLAGTLTVGVMVVLSTYLRNAVSPLSTLVTNGASYGQATAGLEQIVGILELPGDPDGTADAPPRGSGPAALRFENVSFAYTRDRIALHDVDLEVAPGETVMIVGESGAGKTTVLRLAQRFYRPFRGRVTLDGLDVADLPDAWLRGQIALVPQEPFLFTGTIRDNIAYGRPDASEEDILQAARATFVDRFVHNLPDGYDTVVDEDGSSISAGERQLVTIARAFLADPALLILDEATSSVDTRTEVLVQKAMAALRSDRTSFVIAHRLSTIRDADLILVMEAGAIVEQGTHEELLAVGGAYAALYNSQFAQAVA